MRPRGIALPLALLAIFILSGLALYWGRLAIAQVKTQAESHGRECALRQAERALTMARKEVRDGRMRLGDTTKFSGTFVSCTKASENLELSAVGLWPEKGARGSWCLRVKVVWRLSSTNGAKVEDWRVEDSRERMP